MGKYFLYLLLLSLIGLYSTSSVLTVDNQDLSLLTNENKTFKLTRSSDPDNSSPVLVSFNYSNGDSNLLVNIPSLEIRPGENLTVTVAPRKAGHVDILANTEPET